MKLPTNLFVYISGDGDEACMIAEANVSEIPEDQHGEKVGVYVLHDTCILAVKKELV